MEKKIRGVEHELAMNTIPSLPHGSLIHLVGMGVEELKKLELVTKIPVEHEAPVDVMALNGFRVYNDMSHLELSSPSYTSSLEAVVYDKVAELFGFYAVRGLKGYFREVNAYKNNISNLPTGEPGAKAWRAVSYSTHSSILMARRAVNHDIWDKVEEALIPFMVARIPLIGGGDLVPTPKDGFPRPGKEMHGETLRFAISPRAVFAKRLSSNDTVSARGLLNQRDDPHANENYWRLHDINWEGLRSPFQIYLRDSLEALVMTAYERGYLKNPPKLEDPLTAIKEISLDPEKCDWKVTLEGGERVDALAEIMEGHYLAGIEEMMGENEATEEDRMGFNLIKAVLGGLGERRLEYFIDGLDWVTKKALIDEYAPGDVEEALGICNQYTLLDEGVLRFIGEPVEPGLTQTTFDLEASIDFAGDAIPVVDWGGLGGLVKDALTRGPVGSREYLRGLVAREFPFMVERIEWERITFPNATILLDEPFAFSKEACGDTLEEATTNLSTFLHAVNQLSPKGDRIVRAPVDDHELRDREGGVNH
jgi:hypothetical protein